MKHGTNNRSANRPGSQRPDTQRDDRNNSALHLLSAALRTGTVRGPVAASFGGARQNSSLPHLCGKWVVSKNSDARPSPGLARLQFTPGLGRFTACPGHNRATAPVRGREITPAQTRGKILCRPRLFRAKEDVKIFA